MDNIKVGHVSTVGMNYFPCVVFWNRLWKLIMQLVKSKNCPALCLDSSAHTCGLGPSTGSDGERQNFLPLQIHVSASKSGGPKT